MRDTNLIQKIPGCKGIYGARYWVDASLKQLNELFKVLSVWNGSTDRKEENGITMLMYEMPLDHNIEDNPLIMKILYYNNAMIA